jgi:flagellar motor switch protein FliN/FliY
MSEIKDQVVGDVNVRITVELGRARKKIEEVINFAPGSMITLDKLAGDPVDIYVNNTLFARGEVVTISENFGARVTEVMSKDQRNAALQSMTKKG